ncbi:MAG: hypothetical protein U0531_18275 [Dehalococcoidia bacterium]
MWLLYGVRLSDLPSFKAIGRADLLALGIGDLHYGWTAEMIARAARRGLPIIEEPIDYRVRIGESKVSGSWRASVKAGVAILRAVIGVRFERSGAGRRRSTAASPDAPAGDRPRSRT